MTNHYACTLSAEDWQLYTASKDCSKAAAAINAEMTRLVQDAQAKLADDPCLSERKLAERVRDEMHVVLDRYSKFGACDTEPQCALVAEIERALGLSEYSLDRW